MVWLLGSDVTCFSCWCHQRNDLQSCFLFQRTYMNVRWNSFLYKTKKKTPVWLRVFFFLATPLRRLFHQNWLVYHHRFRAGKGWEHLEKINLLLYSHNCHEHINIGLYSGRSPCAERSGKRRWILRSFAILIMTCFFIRFVVFHFTTVTPSCTPIATRSFFQVRFYYVSKLCFYYFSSYKFAKCAERTNFHTVVHCKMSFSDVENSSTLSLFSLCEGKKKKIVIYFYA